MIRLIAAIDRQRGLGKHGGQPWYIPEDEAYFTRLTQEYGGEVLVGGTTFRTFHGPLVGRQNHVLTRDKTPIDGVELVHDLEKFLAEFQDRDLWVIGGADVFTQVVQLRRADELYLTKIEADFGCQQFFPPYEDTFTVTEQSDLQEQNGFLFTYTKYVPNATY